MGFYRSYSFLWILVGPYGSLYVLMRPYRF